MNVRLRMLKVMLFKVAEHSFRALLLMQFSTCTRISKNKHAVNRAIILLTQHPHYLCYFSGIERSLLMALVLYYKDMLEKVTMQLKKPSSFQLLFFTERTQLNATHAQLLEKLRPIALAETCRFLMIQSLEFQEIWQNDSLETTGMIYHKKSEF